MGEYMVVIGEHVPYVYEEVCKEIGLNHEEGIVKVDKKKESIPQKVLGIVMNAMGPTLNLMCACGMIKGFFVLATMLGLSQESGVYALANAAGDSFFYFLPLLLGYNVAKKL